MSLGHSCLEAASGGHCTRGFSSAGKQTVPATGMMCPLVADTVRAASVAPVGKTAGVCRSRAANPLPPQ